MKKSKIITDPKFALDICQRLLEKGYISDIYGDDDIYTSGYANCLKDIAFLLLGDDNQYGMMDKTT